MVHGTLARRILMQTSVNSDTVYDMSTQAQHSPFAPLFTFSMSLAFQYVDLLGPLKNQKGLDLKIYCLIFVCSQG